MKKQKVIWIFLWAGSCLMSTNSLFAQENLKSELPTGKVTKKVDDNKKATPKNTKKIGLIYVKKGKNLLIGNACAEQVTKEMGFQYELEDRPDDSFHSNWKRIWHNTGVKTKLVFTKGPWWKSNIKKKFKQCAIQSGDFRG